ncbi:cysteine synthase A [Sesbania bispinosa]|nr:cysteine synthase A [Sesbania bispinosa]
MYPEKGFFEFISRTPLDVCENIAPERWRWLGYEELVTGSNPTRGLHGGRGWTCDNDGSLVGDVSSDVLGITTRDGEMERECSTRLHVVAMVATRWIWGKR